MHHERFLTNGPQGSRSPRVVLAHGAGAPMDSPFMNRIADGLGRGGLSVVRFEFPYMARRREDGKRRAPDRGDVLRRSWLEVIERFAPARRLVIGGKSMGGRIASLVADEAGVAGLVCLGYPFHPAGRPERLRAAHLAQIATPTLIVQGTRDPLGNREEIAGYVLSERVRVEFIEDGDHSLEPRKRSGSDKERSLEQAISAVTAFVAAR
ncbi:MAG TPA: alpha/beta family hydrolase [Candidatus Polarisedimenticolaceae bacterium]|nr:alpha/beta family hydrolase [Candidatus Polarisedimenticolaceae bacterium]